MALPYDPDFPDEDREPIANIPVPQVLIPRDALYSSLTKNYLVELPTVLLLELRDWDTFCQLLETVTIAAATTISSPTMPICVHQHSQTTAIWTAMSSLRLPTLLRLTLTQQTEETVFRCKTFLTRCGYVVIEGQLKR